MSTLYGRHTKFESKLDKKKDIYITIDGIPTIIEYSYHSIKRSKHRLIFEAAVTMMIQNAFDNILDLHNDERFIVIDSDLCISVIGALKAVGGDIIVSIVSVIDSDEPTNPHGTYTIAI
jgi:hypothetical protein